MPPTWLLDSRILAAVIGAAAVALGWFVTARREKGAERRARLQRERDMSAAIAAEIGAHVEALQMFDLEEHWRMAVVRMEADPNYVITVPRERRDVMFRALIEEVTVLPDAAIGAVVRYYVQLFAVEAIVGDLRSSAFRERMTQPQRIAMYTDYIGMKQEALVRGEAALETLKPPRRRRLLRSSRDAAG